MNSHSTARPSTPLYEVSPPGICSTFTVSGSICRRVPSSMRECHWDCPFNCWIVECNCKSVTVTAFGSVTEERGEGSSLRSQGGIPYVTSHQLLRRHECICSLREFISVGQSRILTLIHRKTVTDTKARLIASLQFKLNFLVFGALLRGVGLMTPYWV
jgi:hypothetical protein